MARRMSAFSSVTTVSRISKGDSDSHALQLWFSEGYSTMCGHATIALGRFLVDSQDHSVSMGQKQLPYLSETQETLVRLHAPCGVVTVSVPTIRTPDSVKSDPQRRVSFLSVPSFVSAINVTVKVPQDKRWKALLVSGRDDVTLDVAFGGAFYGIVNTSELGFESGIRGHCLADFKEASKTLNDILSARKELFSHPDEEDLEYLYGVIITENLGERRELGLCFFADQQTDRSPTGSGVCARVALAIEKGGLEIGEDVTFESVVSLRGEGAGFVGKAIGLLTIAGKDGIIRNATQVRVEGQAYYTGAHSFVAEEGDMLSDGFVIE